MHVSAPGTVVVAVPGAVLGVKALGRPLENLLGAARGSPRALRFLRWRLAHHRFTLAPTFHADLTLSPWPLVTLATCKTTGPVHTGEVLSVLAPPPPTQPCGGSEWADAPSPPLRFVPARWASCGRHHRTLPCDRLVWPGVWSSPHAGVPSFVSPPGICPERCPSDPGTAVGKQQTWTESGFQSQVPKVLTVILLHSDFGVVT